MPGPILHVIPFLWSGAASDPDGFEEWFARVLDLPPLVEVRR